jgi:hypothetical protein
MRRGGRGRSVGIRPLVGERGHHAFAELGRRVLRVRGRREHRHAPVQGERIGPAGGAAAKVPAHRRLLGLRQRAERVIGQE